MDRIIVRHLSGSKANQLDEFPLNHFQELTFGRDPSVTVRYDPDRDDLVGRQHAKIVADSTESSQFTITDLNSRNGTYINKQRIVSSTKIAPGDTVQLGPGGPEFQFDLEPRPQNAIKATRIAISTEAATLKQHSSLPHTRVPGSEASSHPTDEQTATAHKQPIGKKTVERLINQNILDTKKSEGRKYLMIGGAALAAVLMLFGAFALLTQRRQSDIKAVQAADKIRRDQEDEVREANRSLTPGQIVKANGNAVVKISVAWRLISPNGGLVYHQYLPNRKVDKDGRDVNDADGVAVPLVAGAGKYLACYVQTSGGRIEPYLTLDNPNEYTGRSAIGGAGEGSGFAVTSDGFILTNSHVATAWQTEYALPEEADFGLLFGPDKETSLGPITNARSKIRWIPEKTQQGGLRFDGRNDRLEVTFPDSRGSITATRVRSSDRHDVTLIKINVPNSVPEVKLNDNYDTIQPGDAAVVLGYPAVSKPIYGVTKSQNMFNRQPNFREIADPTTSVGNVSRLVRGRKGSDDEEERISVLGDFYQLTINSTGAGNSGGPVFDDRGQVTGIFFAGLRTADVAVTAAIPIRYGKELLSVSGQGR